VQGAKQVIPVFPSRIEDSRGDANVMLLCLRGDLRLIWSGRAAVAPTTPEFTFAEEFSTA